MPMQFSFRGTSLLWGLDLGDDLDPQDPVAATRHPLCDIAFPGPLEILHREQCYRASAGHPNVHGRDPIRQTNSVGVAIGKLRAPLRCD